MVSSIYTGFEGYRIPNREEYISVLREGFVVVDANLLLDLYRFGEQGRKDLLAALRALGTRLWVPHQAMLEFWKNREGVLKDPGGTKELTDSLSKARDAAHDAIAKWGRLRSHPESTIDELRTTIAEALESVIKQVNGLTKEETTAWARDTSGDPVLRDLSTILSGKVGRCLPEEAYVQALAEAKRRADSKIPPGYMDAKKPTPDFAGDYLVWEELLLEAERRAQDVLFITRDSKEDWVRIESGETRGPRIELQEELLSRVGKRFYLRTPAQFLELVKESLNVDINLESVEDATRISDQIDVDWTARKGSFTSSSEAQAPQWNLETAGRFLEGLTLNDQLCADATMMAVMTGGMIDNATLVELGVHPNPDILHRIATGIQEQAKRMVWRGKAPSEALDMVQVVRDEGPNGEQLLRGYVIAQEFLLDLFHATLSPETDYLASPAVRERRRESVRRMSGFQP